MNADTLTPYILAALGILLGVVGWLVRRSIAHGETLIAIKTAFKIYLERTGKGAAEVLDSPNPTPPTMRILLRKYRDGSLTDSERKELRTWLRELKNDETVLKAERHAAISLLAAIEAGSVLRKDH